MRCTTVVSAVVSALYHNHYLATIPVAGTIHGMRRNRRPRNRRPIEKPKINMTPMIDVVFLLLIFFVLTFKIIIPEGDFNVRMLPMGQAQVAATDTDSVQIRLLAHENGSLLAIQLNGDDVENFDLLRQRVWAISLTKPELEVDLYPDEHLRYEYVIRTITAVSGEIHEGHVRKNRVKINFVRQKGETSEPQP